MAEIATIPSKKAQDYAKIPGDALDALVDMMNRRANGVIEFHFAQGGIAKIYGTEKKTYK